MRLPNQLILLGIVIIFDQGLQQSNSETDFFVAFPTIHLHVQVVICNSGGRSAYVFSSTQVKSKSMVMYHVIDAHLCETVDVPSGFEFADINSVVSNKGIHISSSEPVYVQITINNTDWIDTSLILTLSELGSTYYPITEGCQRKNFVLVVATEDETNVQIHMPQTDQQDYIEYNYIMYHGGEHLTVSMEYATQVLRIESDYSLTGMYVEASKPVSVFSGCDCDTNVDTDIAFDHVPSLDVVGYDYAVMSSGILDDIIYIVTTKNDTSFEILNGQTCEDFLKQAGSELNFPFTDVLLLHSNQPIVVAHIIRNTTNRVSMYYVTPMEQCSSVYNIYVHPTFSTEVMFLYETNQIGNFKLDNQLYTPVTLSSLLENITSVRMTNLNTGQHRLETTSGVFSGFVVLRQAGSVGVTSLGYDIQPLQQSCSSTITTGCTWRNVTCSEDTGDLDNTKTLGNSFYVAAAQISTSGRSELVILNPNSFSIEVTMSMKSIADRVVEVPSYSAESLSLLDSPKPSSSNISQSGIHVWSPVSFYLMAYYLDFSTADSYFAFPATVSGNRFLPVTSRCKNDNVVHIIATKFKTDISITFPIDQTTTKFVTFDSVDYYGGQTLNASLAKFSFSVIKLNSKYSLTGTYIFSKTKVAVLSGCEDVTNGDDFQIDQVPSYKLSGHIFYIIPVGTFANISSEYVTIVASKSKTIVGVHSSSCESFDLLYKGSNVEVKLNKEPYQIFSNNPIIVYHAASIGNDRFSGYYVTPWKKFLASYTFYSPYITSFTTVAVVYSKGTILSVNGNANTDFYELSTNRSERIFRVIKNLKGKIPYTIKNTNESAFGGYIMHLHNNRLQLMTLGRKFSSGEKVCPSNRDQLDDSCVVLHNEDLDCAMTTTTTKLSPVTTSKTTASTAPQTTLAAITTTTTQPTTSTTAHTTLATQPTSSKTQQTTSTTAQTTLATRQTSSTTQQTTSTAAQTILATRQNSSTTQQTTSTAAQTTLATQQTTSTTQQTTSAAPQTVSTTTALNTTGGQCCTVDGRICQCTNRSCYFTHYKAWNETEEDIAILTKLLRKQLLVDKRTLSSTIRRKTCANDTRTSAKNMGYVGATMLGLTFGGLFMADIPLLLYELKTNILSKFLK